MNTIISPFILALDRVIDDRQLFAGLQSLFNRDHQEPTAWENPLLQLTRYATTPFDGNSLERYFDKIDAIIETCADKSIDTAWLGSRFRMSKYHFIRSLNRLKALPHRHTLCSINSLKQKNCCWKVGR